MRTISQIGELLIYTFLYIAAFLTRDFLLLHTSRKKTNMKTWKVMTVSKSKDLKKKNL